MARPPRIPVLLPHDHEVIFYLTLCVQGRAPVLANEAAWRAMVGAARNLDRWRTLAMVAMPDHVHILAAPHDREDIPSHYSRWFKRDVRKALGAPWRWQDGVFDHLLRGEESAQEKWLYMRENPTKAGLVTVWHEWPYCTGFGGAVLL